MTAEFQAAQLVLSCCLGLGLGLFYDIYRVWFRAPGGRWLKGLGDIVWWLLALAVAAAALYHINGLELRLFPLALAAAGCCLEQALISPRFFPLLEGVCRFGLRLFRRLLRLLRRLLECLLLPLVWPVELAFRLVLLLKGLLLRLLRALRDLLLWLLRPVLRPLRRLYRRVRRRLKAVLRARLLAEEQTEEQAAEGEP